MKTLLLKTIRDKFSVLIISILLIFAVNAMSNEITFQDGTGNIFVQDYSGTADALIATSGSIYRNYGANSYLYIGNNTGVLERALLRFDLSSLAGKYDTISSATLTLYVVTGPSGTYNINIYQIADANAAWLEGTANGTAQIGSNCWQYLAYSTVDWAGSPGLSSSGTDYESTAVVDNQAFGSTGQFVTFTIPTALIEKWITGVNAGLLIMASDESIQQTPRYASSEYSVVNRRPKLTINYDTTPLTSGQSGYWNIPVDEPQGSDKIYLALKMRISTDGQATTGGTIAAAVSVDDYPLTVERLVNKPEYYKRGTEKIRYTDAYGNWFVGYYAWDYSPLPDSAFHEYVFDITDLVTSEDEVLRVDNIFDAIPDSSLLVRDVQIYTDDSFSKSSNLPTYPLFSKSRALNSFRLNAIGIHNGFKTLPAQTDYNQDLSSSGDISYKTNYSQNFSIAANANGTLTLTQGSDTSTIKSYIGEPSLTSIPPLDNSNWTLVTSYPASNQIIMVFSRSNIRITRTINIEDSYIKFDDYVENLTSSDLPVVVLNSMDFGSTSAINQFRVSGIIRSALWANDRPSKEFAMSPVVFVGRSSSSLAMVCEDDAYRNHGSVLAWGDGAVGVGDEMFYLGPANASNDSYTFTWKLYPVDGTNYYDTVNILRKEWYYTPQEIPGLFGFLYETDYEGTGNPLTKLLTDTGMTIPTLMVKEAYCNQPTLFYPLYGGGESLTRIEDGIDLLEGNSRICDLKNAVSAGFPAQLSLYCDVNLFNFNGNTSLLGADTMKDEDNYYRPFTANVSAHVIPTEGSQSAEALYDMTDYCLGNAGYNSLFLDEWHYSRYSEDYAHQDGMTAIINSDFSIQDKIGLAPILTKNFKESFCNYIASEYPNAVLFANLFDGVSQLQYLPIVHFGEPVSYSSGYITAAQLGRTPLCLALKRQTAEKTWGDVREYLKQGVLTCYYGASTRMTGNHILKRVFPFTALEVHSGYVLGDKKIITSCSGTYTLGRTVLLTAYIYSGTGTDGIYTRKVESSLLDGVHKITLSLSTATNEVAVIAEQGAVFIKDSIEFQEGVTNEFVENYSGTDDALIAAGGSIVRNYGANSYLYIGNNSGILERALLRFDLSSLAGKYSSISSATLTLYAVTGSSGTYNINIHQIADANAAWEEGTANGSAQIGSNCWQYLAYNTVNWAGSAGLSSSGTDYIATAVVDNQPFGATGRFVTFDLPVTLIENWITGTNAGLLIMASDESIQQAPRYASSEYSTIEYRPKLTIKLEP